MLIFKDNKLEVYENNLFNNEGQISFQGGKVIDVDSRGRYIVPGFIDQHIHGAGGYDVMDNTTESLAEMSRILPQEGTTSFFPTTMTYDIEVLKEIMVKVKEEKGKEKGANIIGVHLEGPFINEEYIGAQNPLYVQTPSVELLKEIDPLDQVRLITYAPEKDENLEFTRYMREKGIIPSVGHSAATCACVREAIKNGLYNFTHFQNASSPFHHRDPGVVNAGIEDQTGAKLELIVDGIHLHPDAVSTVYNSKTSDNLLLITDAMRAKGMPDGNYDLGGQTVIKSGNEARLGNGALAGSVLLMNNAVKNFLSFTNAKIEEAFQMASYNPARHHGLTQKGVISEGKDLDVTVLDENYEVIQTFVGGRLVYQRPE